MLLLMFVFTIVAAVASAVDAPIPVAAGVVSADAVNIGGTGVGLVVVASAASVPVSDKGCAGSWVSYHALNGPGFSRNPEPLALSVSLSCIRCRQWYSNIA